MEEPPWRREPLPQLVNIGDIEAYCAAVRSALDGPHAALLDQLRASLHDDVAAARAQGDLEAAHDAWIVRFLRGNGWKLGAAEAQAKESLAWRRESRVSTWPYSKLTPSHWPSPPGAAAASPPSGVAAAWRAGWHGCDVEGRPVFIDRTIGMDPAALKAAEPTGWLDEVVGLALAECERHTELCAACLRSSGRLFERHTVVVDCEGLSLSLRHLVPVFKRIAALAGTHYPDTVHKLVVVRAPFGFATAYSLVKPFIDPNSAWRPSP
jgi:hypothetical protein